MKIKPITITSNLDGSVISETAFLDDSYFMCKTMNIENYDVDNVWGARIISGAYFTFLETELMKEGGSIHKAFSIYSSPAAIMRVYKECLTKRSIDINSDEAGLYLINLLKGFASAMAMINFEKDGKASMTATVLSTCGFFLSKYVDDVEYYVRALELKSGSKLSSGHAEDVLDVVTSATLMYVYNNLISIALAKGYNVAKIIEEADEVLKEMHAALQEVDITTFKAVDKYENSNIFEYVFRDILSGEELDNYIKETAKMMVYKKEE